MARRGKDTAGTGTPALVLLHRERVVHSVHPYTHDDDATDFGAEAVRELGVDAARVFKTLVIDAGDGRDLAVAVVPVNAMLDLKAAAQALGRKRFLMADRTVAAQRTGYVPGGISPLGQKRVLPTVVDCSAVDFDTVFVSGGRRGLDVELDPAELVRLTEAVLHRVALYR